MSRFSGLTSDKQIILSKLVSSQELCKALYYNDKNFLDQADISDTSALVYDRIFPHFFVPAVDENAKTYITLSFRNYRLVNDSYKAGFIHVHSFTHKTLYRSDYGKLRTDFLLEKIDGLLNDISGISIGGLKFDKMDEYIVNQNYSGNYVVYKTYDFN